MHKFYRAAGLSSPAFFWVCLLLLMATDWAWPALAQGMLLPTTQLTIGPHKVWVEIAATEASRSYGLMNRASLPPNHGMLFVFETDQDSCFWMKNTPLPLTIAFIDAQGDILNMADMQPHTTDTHCPAAPVRYALEMAQGWFATHGVRPRTTVYGLPGAQ